MCTRSGVLCRNGSRQTGDNASPRDGTFASWASTNILGEQQSMAISSIRSRCLHDTPKMKSVPLSSACPGKGLRRIDYKLDMIELSTPPIPSTDKGFSTPADSPPASSSIIDNDIAWKHNANATSRGIIHSIHVGLSIASIHCSSKECNRYQMSSPPSIAEVIPDNLFISDVFERTDAQPFQLQPRPSPKCNKYHATSA